jgi:hypothetical protein
MKITRLAIRKITPKTNVNINDEIKSENKTSGPLKTPTPFIKWSIVN